MQVTGNSQQQSKQGEQESVVGDGAGDGNETGATVVVKLAQHGLPYTHSGEHSGTQVGSSTQQHSKQG